MGGTFSGIRRSRLENRRNRVHRSTAGILLKVARCLHFGNRFLSPNRSGISEVLWRLNCLGKLPVRDLGPETTTKLVEVPALLRSQRLRRRQKSAKPTQFEKSEKGGHKTRLIDVIASLFNEHGCQFSHDETRSIRIGGEGGNQMIRKARFQYAFIGIVALSLLSAVAPKSASATPIDWATWSSNSTGTISGLGITITYSGQMDGISSAGYPSWTPTGTFSGGTVGNPPPSSGHMIQLTGGTTTVDTIVFSAPVVNPVMAIWSLGNSGSAASFNFTASEPFTIQSGGPSAEFGGSAIFVCSGNSLAVCGAEGNGTIQFQGTFSSISWTNPTFENYYGFTIGAPSSATAVPEPASILLIASGLVGVIRLRGRKAAPRG